MQFYWITVAMAIATSMVAAAPTQPTANTIEARRHHRRVRVNCKVICGNGPLASESFCENKACSKHKKGKQDESEKLNSKEKKAFIEEYFPDQKGLDKFNHEEFVAFATGYKDGEYLPLFGKA